MRVHYLQHVPFEDLGSMCGHFSGMGAAISRTRLYEDESLPDSEAFDWLVVMGGPMGVNDADRYPWLTEERKFIRRSIDEGKVTIGICLGAQLIAAALGAGVSRNSTPEIGWHPVAEVTGVRDTLLTGLFAEPTSVFHWHSDTFALPEGAIRLLQSEACHNQAFSFGTRVLALQFHLETTMDSAAALVENCGQGLESSRFVQETDMILADADAFARINALMSAVVDRLAAANHQIPG